MVFLDVGRSPWRGDSSDCHGCSRNNARISVSIMPQPRAPLIKVQSAMVVCGASAKRCLHTISRATGILALPETSRPDRDRKMLQIRSITSSPLYSLIAAGTVRPASLLHVHMCVCPVRRGGTSDYLLVSRKGALRLTSRRVPTKAPGMPAIGALSPADGGVRRKLYFPMSTPVYIGTRKP